MAINKNNLLRNVVLHFITTALKDDGWSGFTASIMFISETIKSHIIDK